MTPTPPNGIGIDILDTAQLDPGYVLELVERFDMAQVTIVEATHTKEAFGLATKLLIRRPHMDVFYRRRRDELPDERMPDMVRPDEWVNYMRDVLEAGMVCAVYNESQKSPMTPLTTYSKRIIELTAPNSWRTVHFKTATGTPIGYKGEQPDGYAESDDLWRAMAAVNKTRMDAGQKPLAYAAPHAYFASWGLQSGHTDRPAEIVRRLKSDALKIDPAYVPISIGETGVIAMDSNGHISDAEAGFVGQIGSEAYAALYGDVLTKAFLPLNATGHLFALGDKHPGNSQWKRFDLYKNKVFWDKLEILAADGRYRLSRWYGAGFSVPSPTTPTFPTDFDTRAKKYMVRATDGATTVRHLPNRLSAPLTTIAPTPSITTLIDAADLRAGERVQETINDRLGVWLPVQIGSVKGWVFNGYLDVQPVIVSPPPVELPPLDLVKWQVVIQCQGTTEQRAAHKQMWSAVSTFLKQGLTEVQPTQDITVKDVP